VLRGHGSGSGGVIFKFGEYIVSPEFQTKAKAAATTLAVVSGCVTLAFGAEDAICSKILGTTTFTQQAGSWAFRGTYTTHPDTLQEFNRIARFIPKDKLITFCKPGTSELDDEAINDAFLEYKA
jgi:hypothetical protein